MLSIAKTWEPGRDSDLKLHCVVHLRRWVMETIDTDTVIVKFAAEEAKLCREIDTTFMRFDGCNSCEQQKPARHKVHGSRIRWYLSCSTQSEFR